MDALTSHVWVEMQTHLLIYRECPFTKVKFLYPLFSLEKKGILISCQSRSVVRFHLSVTLLVNVSPPKPLEVATSNFVVEYVT